MSPQPSDNRDIARKLHKLAFLMDRLAEQALSDDADLTFAQFRMLMALRRFGQIPQKRIASFHGLTEAAVSRQIDTLVEKKLIRREPNTKNRREHLLSLTEKGETESVKAHKVLDARFSKLFGVVGEKQREQFRATLTFLLDAIWEEGKYLFCGPRPKEKNT